MPAPDSTAADAKLIAGAMSGTSADGVDVALVRVTGRGEAMRAHLVAHRHRPYSEALRRLIFTTRGGDAPVRMADLARCGREVSLAYAAAVNDCLAAADVAAGDVAAVAAHGQTLYHAPPDTIQWLDPALLAAETGCAVVSDFRRADCAAGGQGAPLVPFADYVLFRDPHRTRVLLNIGGIANITILRRGASIVDVVAFDTGPGNCISDWLCRSLGSSGASRDEGGGRASRGRVLEDVLGHFLRSPYFSEDPPKSTDGPAMIAAFEAATAGRQYETNDLLATAAYATASTIERAIRVYAREDDGDALDVVVSGGGVNNRAIMGWLQSVLSHRTVVRNINELGVPPDAKEAIAFALLAAATLDGLPSNVPSATGARRPVVLGSITPRP